MMRALGLIPSDTGQPGAARLARKSATISRRAEGDAAKRKKKSASQTRYTCHGCGVNAWAKPDVRLVCGDCDEKLEADPDAA